MALELHVLSVLIINVPCEYTLVFLFNIRQCIKFNVKLIIILEVIFVPIVKIM